MKLSLSILVVIMLGLTNGLHLTQPTAHQDYLMTHMQKQQYQVKYTEAPPASAFSDDLINSNLNYYMGNLDSQTYYSWQNTIKNNNKSSCNGVTPYATFNSETINNNKIVSSQCISCEPIVQGININTAKILFNLETRRCQVCRPNTTAICNSLLNIDSTVPLVLPNQPVVDTTPIKRNTTASIFDLCPPAQPFYNANSKQCQVCPKSSQFDGPTQKCVPVVFMMNTRASNLILDNLGQIQNQKYALQQANKERNIQQCPIERPYLQNSVCIKCLENELYNATSQTCTQGCPEGFFYNREQRNCGKATYYSDSSAGNILSQTGSFQSWKKETDSLNNTSIGVLKCPSDRPYSINNACVGCSGDTPLFNIDQNKCSGCSKGRYYNSEKHECLGILDQSSSLKRMIANIS